MRTLRTCFLMMLMAVLLLCLPLLDADAAELRSGSCGEALTWTFDPDSGLLTISGSGAMTEFQNTELTRQSPWYSFRSEIQELRVEEGVTTLCSDAFESCEHLRTVRFPSSLRRIGWGVFYACEALESAVFPEGLETLGAYAFGRCKALRSVSLPDTLTDLQWQCFYQCSSLESVRLPAGLEELQKEVFYSCSALRDIQLPKSLKRIRENAFSFSGLENIELPDGLIALEAGALSNCKSLDHVTIPSSVSECGTHLFFGCSSLAEVTLPTRWDTLPQQTFDRCTALETVTLPDGIRFIKDSAFSECASLQNVHLPAGLQTLGSGVFSSCTSLKSIMIPDALTALPEYSFAGCQALETVSLPAKLGYIGRYAFRGCVSLQSFSVPEGVNSLGSGAFAYCTALKELELPISLVRFKTETISGCIALNSVYFHGSEAQWQEIFQEDQTPSFTVEYNTYVLSEPSHPSNWAIEEVEKAIAAGLVPEVLCEQYQATMYRTEMAWLLSQLVQHVSGRTRDELVAEWGLVLDWTTFSDYYDEDVLFCAALGLLKGVGVGRFDPGGVLQREQIAAVINRTAELFGVQTGGFAHRFADVRGRWSDKELGWPSSVGILLGRSETVFDPTAELTREQAIVVMGRAWNVLTENKP